MTQKEAFILILSIVTIVVSIEDDDPEVMAVKFDDNNTEMENSLDHLRQRRQTAATDDNCQFDVSNNDVSKCSLIINADKLKFNAWRLGRGTGSFWIGGPEKDASDSADGGYAFASMSDLLKVGKNDTAWMLTTPRSGTDAKGRCLKFKYAFDGLSTKTLSIYLLTYRDNNVTAKDLDSSIILPSNGEGSGNKDPTNETEVPRDIKYDLSDLLNIRETTDGEWVDGKASFSSISLYSIAIVATAESRYSLYRGYVAIDNIAFTTGPCDNDCTFDSNLCTWTNADTGDEFDWSQARSTSKRGTGPSRDQASSITQTLKTGGYVFIDSNHPRRSGDKARLTSAEITAKETPLCVTFWVHMYGGGIGKLEVLRQIGNEEITKLWQKSGTSGLERWNPSQLTVTAKSGTKYRVIFQADIGERGSGDIGLDTVAFREGACPQLPPGSSAGASIGDCTFLINTCEWRLQQPPTLTTSFTPMLKQVSGSYSTPGGKTQVPYGGTDYYMSYEMGNYKHRVRDSAFLISPTIQNTGDGICLSFWVYMYTNVPTEIKIGSLTVIVATAGSNVTVWRLENKQQSRWEYAQVAIKETSPFQVYIQGTKGTKKHGLIGVDDLTFYNSDCKLQPPEAYVSSNDCSFDTNPCTWKVETPASVSPPADSRAKWRYADFGQALNVLIDHTYGIEKSGFMFVEAFNSDVTSQLVSPSLEGTDDSCLSFFFASFYSDNTAKLTISSRNADGVVNDLWTVTQANLPPRPEGNTEVEWNYGQVTIKAPTQTVIQGKVRKGGWAVDDIKLTNGTCLIRPEVAAVSSTATISDTQ